MMNSEEHNESAKYNSEQIGDTGIKGPGSPDSRKLTPTAGDYALIGAKSLASLIPVAGGPLAELLDLISPPIEKRRDAFLLALAEDVRMLKADGIDVEKLFTEDAFVSTVLHAAQIAVRNHQQEKLQALRTAIRNSARLGSPSADLRLMFLSFVDTFTIWHLRVLQYHLEEREFSESIRRLRTRNGEPINPPLAAHFVELRGHEYFANQVVQDLISRGLLAITPSPKGIDNATASRLFVAITTEFGRQFLAFVRSDQTSSNDDMTRKR